MSSFQRITAIIAFASMAILAMIVITYGLVMIGAVSENDTSTWSEFVLLFANPYGVIGLLIVMIVSAVISIRAK